MVNWLTVPMATTAPDAQCKICKGKGLVFSPSSRKRGISLLEPCSCVEKACECDQNTPYMIVDSENNALIPCACKTTRDKLNRIRTLSYKAALPRRYQSALINNFETDFEDADVAANMASALDSARHFINDLHDHEISQVKGLYLYGPSGTGKTMLSCIIINEVIIRYQLKSSYLKITRDFFNRIRATFNNPDSQLSAENIFQEIAGTTLVVLDDFGVQADSEWEQRTLYDLLDFRYENELPTVITSNMAPQEFQSLANGRIYSRLKEMTDFQQMIAPDYRDRFTG